MSFDYNFNLKSTEILLKEKGLGDGGPVQRFVDSECIRLMGPYEPALNMGMEKSVVLGTAIGSGKIEYLSPYARYQYYGKLMVSSLTGSSYASKGEKKVLTDKDLIYNKSVHPLAGPYWFERMKADKKDQILKGAQRIANGGKP